MCTMPRGKMLGGTSSLNQMVFVRGSSNIYNKWSSLGNSGWDYESVLPYFKKFEGNQNASLVAYANGRYHSASGPVKTTFGYLPPLAESFIAALKSAGEKFIDDINADKKLGNVILQTFGFNGRRSSTAEAYLAPIKHRPNLHVIKHAYAKKVLINRENAAYGVEFIYKGTHVLRAKSKKEVIVSAGTIQSPTLLMRSGIGPKSYLESINISCKADLAVGENFIDHVYVYLPFALNASTTPSSPTANIDGIYQYAIHKTGPIGPYSLISTFLDTTNTTRSPDIQLVYCFIPGNSNQPDILNVAVILIAPKSRGVIRLNTNSSRQDSIIYTNFLTDKRDLELMLTAIKKQMTLMKSPALKRIGAKFTPPSLSQCDAFEYQSDAYWECFIKYQGGSTCHQHGSSKMGIDRKAVVDPRLKVHGITGLRQADVGMYVLI